MTTNDILAVMDREAALLEADNWHASAVIMREAADHLRARAEVDRRARAVVAWWRGEMLLADLAPELREVLRALDVAVSKVPMRGDGL